jgi:hypothetical protein
LLFFTLSLFFFSTITVYRWFRQTKLPSFHRQLNLYGFKRLTSGKFACFFRSLKQHLKLHVLPSHSNIFISASLLVYAAGHDKGGYYHELFLRNKRFLSYRIQRTKIKGTGARKPSSPETEPSFYTIPYLPATRVPSENAPVSSVGNMPPLGPNMPLGDVGLVSLQQLVAASRELAVSILQQQLAPPPLFNTSTRLLVEAPPRQARLQRLRVVPLHQEMGTIASFELHNFPMVPGRNDLVTAMALALFWANQDPAALDGLPGFWKGSHG